MSWRSIVEHDGAAVIPQFADGPLVDLAAQEFERLCAEGSARQRSGAVFGLRGLLRRSRVIGEIASADPFLGAAISVIGPEARPVRAVFFDKTPEANWPLAWHQDRSAAISGDADAAEDAGLRNPTTKDGTPHWELPRAMLREMVTLRLHLDPADGETGALMIAPGRHRDGIIPAREMRAIAAEARTLTVGAGDAVVMRPLCPHASRRLTRPARRRVLHIEYSAAALPEGLSWGEAA